MVALKKQFKKATAESGPEGLLAIFNHLVGQTDANARTIESALNSIKDVLVTSYETEKRPDPVKTKVGTMIYNTTTSIPNFCDGKVWRNAAGTAV